MSSEADLSRSNDSLRSQSAKSVSHLNEMVSSLAIRSFSQSPLGGLDVWGDLFEVLEAQRRIRLRDKTPERLLRDTEPLGDSVDR
jgi:hypothetical protein